MAKSARPTLGIAARTFRRRRFGEQTSYLRGLVAIARRKGMNAYVFGPGDVDWPRQRVRGWSPVPGGWRRRWHPLPDVVYDRVWGLGPLGRRRFAEELKRFEEHGIPCFNPDFGDKLDVYRTLHGTEALAPHLPETLPLTAENLLALAARHRYVYVKPARGRQGKGISVCRKLKRGWHWTRASAPRRSQTLPSAEAVVAACRRGRAGDAFLVQQGLDLVRLASGTVDVRVIVQRDSRGQWQVSAVGVRAGRRGRLVSNLHAGGRAMGLSRLVRAARIKGSLARIRRQVAEVALLAAEALSRAHPSLGELGVDIGLGPEGRAWILEVNRQPGRALFARARLRKAWRRSRIRVVEFARFLAQGGLALHPPAPSGESSRAPVPLEAAAGR